MPAKPPTISPHIASKLQAVGLLLRDHRKRLGVSAAQAAESAGMSRITWYRIEQGSAAVTLGAYMQALSVLGLDIDVHPLNGVKPHGADNKTGWLPTRITLADYPQLQQLAWHVRGSGTFALSPREALDIYERHGRHLDKTAMSDAEQQLLASLQDVLGNPHGV